MDISSLVLVGYVGKDYEELVYVFITLVLSMAVMVAFGAWWQR